MTRGEPAQSGGPSPLAQIEQSASALRLESARVLVAVSGGSDSVALLRGLSELQSKLNLTLIVAHFNHGWRGEESKADATWVEALAASLKLRCLVESTAIARPAIADETASANPTSEETARRDRYEFLTRAATEHNCQFVAVGHTADDQTETVLHHILRGTGLAGLRGISRSRPLGENTMLVRPLLESRREDLAGWLSSIGQHWRTDRTNDDVRFTRNRIRNELLPLLEEQFNPKVRRVLTTLAQQAGELSDFVRELAEKAIPQIVLSSAEDSIRFDTTALSQLPSVVRRESLVLAWQQQNWPLQGMSFSHWEKLAEIASSGGTATLPGRIDVRLRGSLLVLTRSHRTPKLQK